MNFVIRFLRMSKSKHREGANDHFDQLQEETDFGNQDWHLGLEESSSHLDLEDTSWSHRGSRRAMCSIKISTNDHSAG